MVEFKAYQLLEDLPGYRTLHPSDHVADVRISLAPVTFVVSSILGSLINESYASSMFEGGPQIQDGAFESRSLAYK